MIEQDIYGRTNGDHINANGQRIGLGFGRLAFSKGFDETGGIDMNVQSYPNRMPDCRGNYPILFAMYRQKVGEDKPPVQVLQTNRRIVTSGGERHLAHQYAAVGEDYVRKFLTYPERWMQVRFQIQDIDRVNYQVGQFAELPKNTQFKTPPLSDVLKYFKMTADTFEMLLCSLFESVQHEDEATVILINDSRQDWFAWVRCLLVHIFTFLPLHMRGLVGFETWFTGSFMSGAINLCFYPANLFYVDSGRMMLKMSRDGSKNYDVTGMPVFREAGMKFERSRWNEEKDFRDRSTYRDFIHPWLVKALEPQMCEKVEVVLNNWWILFDAMPDGSTESLDGFVNLLEYKRVRDGGALPEIEQLVSWSKQFCLGTGAAGKKLLAQKIDTIQLDGENDREALIDQMIFLLDKALYGDEVFNKVFDIISGQLETLRLPVKRMQELLEMSLNGGLALSGALRVAMVRNAVDDADPWFSVACYQCLMEQNFSVDIIQALLDRASAVIPKGFEPDDRADGVFERILGRPKPFSVYNEKLGDTFCQNIQPDLRWVHRYFKDATDPMLAILMAGVVISEDAWDDIAEALQMLSETEISSGAQDSIFGFIRRAFPERFTPNERIDQILTAAMGDSIPKQQYREEFAALFNQNALTDLDWICVNTGNVLSKCHSRKVIDACALMLRRTMQDMMLTVDRSDQLIRKVCLQLPEEIADELTADILQRTGYEESDSETVELFMSALKKYMARSDNAKEIAENECALKWLFRDSRLSVYDRVRLALQWLAPSTESQALQTFFDTVISGAPLSCAEAFPLMDHYGEWPEENGIRSNVVAVIDRFVSHVNVGRDNARELKKHLDLLPQTLKDSCVLRIMDLIDPCTPELFVVANSLIDAPTGEIAAVTYEKFNTSIAKGIAAPEDMVYLTDLALHTEHYEKAVSVLNQLLNICTLENAREIMLDCYARSIETMPEYAEAIERRLKQCLKTCEVDVEFTRKFGNTILEKMGVHAGNVLCTLLGRTINKQASDAQVIAEFLLRIANTVGPLDGVCEASVSALTDGTITLQTANDLLDACAKDRLLPGENFGAAVLGCVANFDDDLIGILKCIAGCTIASEDSVLRAAERALTKQPAAPDDVLAWDKCIPEYALGKQIQNCVLAHFKSSGEPLKELTGVYLLMRYVCEEELLCENAEIAFDRLLTCQIPGNLLIDTEMIRKLGAVKADKLFAQLINSIDIFEWPKIFLTHANIIFNWKDVDFWTETKNALNESVMNILAPMSMKQLLGLIDTLNKKLSAQIYAMTSSQIMEVSKRLLKAEESIEVTSTELLDTAKWFFDVYGIYAENTAIALLNCLRLVKIDSIQDVLNCILYVHPDRKSDSTAGFVHSKRWSDAINKLILKIIRTDSFLPIKEREYADELMNWLEAMRLNGVESDSEATGAVIRAALRKGFYTFQGEKSNTEPVMLVNALPKGAPHRQAAVSFLREIWAYKAYESYKEKCFNASDRIGETVSKIDQMVSKVQDYDTKRYLTVSCFCGIIKQNKQCKKAEEFLNSYNEKAKDIKDWGMLVRWCSEFIRVLEDMNEMELANNLLQYFGDWIRTKYYKLLLEFQTVKEAINATLDDVGEISEAHKYVYRLLERIFSAPERMKNEWLPQSWPRIFDAELKNYLKEIDGNTSEEFIVYLRWRIELAAYWSIRLLDEYHDTVLRFLEIEKDSKIAKAFLDLVDAGKKYMESEKPNVISEVCKGYMDHMRMRNGKISYLLRYPLKCGRTASDIAAGPHPADEFAVFFINCKKAGYTTEEELDKISQEFRNNVSREIYKDAQNKYVMLLKSF